MWLYDFVGEGINGSGGDICGIAVVGAKLGDEIGLVLLLEDGGGTGYIVSGGETGTEDVS